MLGVVLDQRVSLGDQISAGSASGSQTKRKAVVRKDSIDTQEYEQCKQEGMDMDADE